MKKIYVSIPMNGRSDDAIESSIEKIRKVSETILDEKVEVVNPFVPKTAKERPIEALGRSIIKMQKADFMVGVYDAWEYAGCQVEANVANLYGVKTIRLGIEYICPDVVKMRREMLEASRSTAETSEV